MSCADQSRGQVAAVILAAGQGTRMRSRTPKLLHSLGGVPLVHHPVAAALQLGSDPVVVVISPTGEAVSQSLVAGFPDAPVRFAIQQEPRGTADAVRAGLAALPGYTGGLLILCGDVPNLRPATLAGLLDAQQQAGAALAFLSFVPESPAAYGRVVRDPAGRPVAIVEAREASPEQLRINEVNAGIYVVDAAFARASLERVQAANSQRELYLTDLVGLAATDGRAVLARRAPAAEVAGINDRVDLAQAEACWRQRRNEELMRAGVTMERPETVFVAQTVQLAADVTLEPGVRLSGAGTVATGAVIGQGSVLHDTVVGEEVRVRPYTVAEGAVLGPRCTVGPFARLRAGTVLGEQVHIGNFVETKKAVLGDGSKAAHLTYLGDAELGRRVNVGCGTITCNYDGFRKYKTRIGDECLIGSDTQLVAPVSLGAGAVTGAGSVVTNDVPAGALAVSRARQRNVENYRDKLRRRYLPED
ncbi:MAG: bifunctional UDP-N-acetylglucosamine diphosphorylase/glucosamine-1-phosphate N-acetyltransferase GlmU [Myxococcota bacterium]|nr:bifunctional UDP-N-acetylglucosamine diphosphorylase/glucosamine-1-phosphate N-acetyltransferase GlmU [Myxococcota bacterium]